MKVQAFVDGGHLRAIARATRKPLPDPRNLATTFAYCEAVQFWASSKSSATPLKFVGHAHVRVGLTRVVYYDAVPDSGAPPLVEEYWKAIELLSDTEVGFGALRGRPRRQKRVDGLIAVDMLVGVFKGLYDVALLIAGDADFVPIVNAVKRQGAMVVVAAREPSLAPELRQAADRYLPIDPEQGAAYFPPLRREDGKVWFENSRGEVSLGEA